MEKHRKAGFLKSTVSVHEKTNRRTEWILLLLLSCATFILYLPTLEYPFQFDDKPNILQNTKIQLTQIGWTELKEILQSTSGRNRPLSVLSFALNYYFGKFDPSGYRLVNILIHIASGMLLYFFTKFTLMLTEKETEGAGGPIEREAAMPSSANDLFLIPFFATAIWIFHPLATNSVTYIVQRMNSMATMFYMLSMVCYIKGRTLAICTEEKPGAIHGRWFPLPSSVASKCSFICSALAALAAIASKEIAITLPFMIFLYEWFFFQNLDRQWIQKKLLWAALIGGAFTAMAIVSFGVDRLIHYFDLYDRLDFTMTQRMMTECRIVFFYIGLLLFPHPSRLNIDHDFTISHSLIDPLTTLLSLVMIGLLLFYAIVTAKRNRLASFTIFWYFGNLTIESTILPLDLLFEHRIYLASMLVISFLVFRVFHLFPWKKVSLTGLTICIVVLTLWTQDRNQVWKSPISLWLDCATKSPGKSRPHVNLGEAYAAEGAFGKAVIQYQKALAINPYSEYTYYNLGAACYALKETEKAVTYFRLALKNNPNFAEAHNNLGVALIDQRQLEEGIHHYHEALRLNPNHPEAPENLRKAQTGLDQINARIAAIEKKGPEDLDDPDLLYNLGFLYYRKGGFQIAENCYRRALEINPVFLKALTGLSILFAETHREPEAVIILREILKQQPNDSGAYYNLACMFARMKQDKESLECLHKAIENGYHNWELMKTDIDLENIRATNGYQELFKEPARFGKTQ